MSGWIVGLDTSQEWCLGVDPAVRERKGGHCRICVAERICSPAEGAEAFYTLTGKIC
jgi:hypothetical protein